MKYTRTTISLPERVDKIGHRRAEQYSLKFSSYLARLIEQDAHSKRNTITLAADLEAPVKFKKPSPEKAEELRQRRKRIKKGQEAEQKKSSG